MPSRDAADETRERMSSLGTFCSLRAKPMLSATLMCGYSA